MILVIVAKRLDGSEQEIDSVEVDDLSSGLVISMEKVPPDTTALFLDFESRLENPNPK